eukprot:GHVU01011694.1.p1 GENE.GHVU01011694.1~~GHVU01011694.1.p1  ORF type:complete len:122 (+),score=9.85 GHVU01011694.1:373-738(+)
MCSTRVTLWCRCCVYPSRPHPCCYSFAHIALEKREVGYYLMAVAPEWKELVLKEVEIPRPFTWPNLKKNMVEGNPSLRKKAALITKYGDKWIDIGDIDATLNGPYLFNIIAITEKGERESD